MSFMLWQNVVASFYNWNYWISIFLRIKTLNYATWREKTDEKIVID